MKFWTLRVYRDSQHLIKRWLKRFYRKLRELILMALNRSAIYAKIGEISSENLLVKIGIPIQIQSIIECRLFAAKFDTLCAIVKFSEAEFELR